MREVGCMMEETVNGVVQTLMKGSGIRCNVKIKML